MTRQTIPTAEKVIPAAEPRPGQAEEDQLADLLDYNINVTESRTHHTPAYPSGHTVYAALGAYLFSELET